jgi:hypothetical protein
MQSLKLSIVLFHFTHATYAESVGEPSGLNLPVLPTTKLPYKRTGFQTQNVLFDSKIASPVYQPLSVTVYTLNNGIISPPAISAALVWS